MNGYACGILIAFFLGAYATAMPSQEEPRQSNSRNGNLLDQIMSDCGKKDPLSCFKYKLFSYMDKTLDGKDSFSLSEGVSVIKTEVAEGAPRSLVDEKSDDVESMFLGRLERFMQTHTFKFDVKGSDVLNGFSNAANSLGLLPNDETEEGRGKKKKAAKILLPLLLALKLKLAALLPLALGAIALIAKKALIVGKIALVLSILIGLKKLLAGGQQKSVTYEIVSHPHHTSHDSYSSGGDYGTSGSGGGGHGSGGWGRSANDAHSMAYKAYQPQQ